MAAVLTAAEKTALRAGHSRLKFFLSLGQYNTLLTATVTGTLARGETQIPYDNGSGDISTVVDGMTLSVGDQVVRVEAITGTATSGTIEVAANALVWVDGQTVTITDDLRLWPKINRIFPKSSAGVFLKNYDEPFSDAEPEPIVLLGEHRVGFVPYSFDVDLTTAQFLGSGVFASSTLDAPAGVTVTDNGDDTYGVTVTTAGQYWLTASVTDDLGQTQTTRRRIFGHSRDRTNSNYPYAAVLVQSLNGGDAGYRLDCTVLDNVPENSVRNYALAVLWTDYDLVGSEQNILFSGYVYPNSIEHNWERGQVRFSAQTVNQFLNQLAINDISLEAVPNPSAWYEFGTNLTTAHAIYHIIKYHSTLFEIADVLDLDVDSIQRKYAEVPAGTLYGMCDYLAKQRLYKLRCGKNGQLHFTPNIQMMKDADRAALPVRLEIEKSDISGQRVIRVQEPTLADVYVTGFYYDGNDHEVYCALAPMSDIMALGPGHKSLPNVILETPGDAAVVAGRALAEGNMPYRSLMLEFPAWWAGIFDIAPAMYFQLDIAATETPRGFVWVNQKLYVERLMYGFDEATQSMRLTVHLVPEAEGEDGVLVECDTDYTIPMLWPSWPPWPEEERVGISGTFAIVLFGESGTYIREYTASDWDERDTDLSAAEAVCKHGIVDPFWWTVYGNNSYDIEEAVLWRGNTKLFESDDGGKSWLDKSLGVNPPNDWSDASAPARSNLELVNYTYNYFLPGNIYALARLETSGGNWRGWLLESFDYGVTWRYITLFSGTAPTDLKPLIGMVSQGTGAYLWMIHWIDDAFVLQKFDLVASTITEYSLGACTATQRDNETLFATLWAPLGDDNLLYVGGRMIDPGGLTGTYHVIKTADGGSTFTSVENTWDAGVCRTLYVGPDESGTRKLYAVRKDN